MTPVHHGSGAPLPLLVSRSFDRSRTVFSTEQIAGTAVGFHDLLVRLAEAPLHEHREDARPILSLLAVENDGPPLRLLNARIQRLREGTARRGEHHCVQHRVSSLLQIPRRRAVERPPVEGRPQRGRRAGGAVHPIYRLVPEAIDVAQHGDVNEPRTRVVAVAARAVPREGRIEQPGPVCPLGLPLLDFVQIAEVDHRRQRAAADRIHSRAANLQGRPVKEIPRVGFGEAVEGRSTEERGGGAGAGDDGAQVLHGFDDRRSDRRRRRRLQRRCARRRPRGGGCRKDEERREAERRYSSIHRTGTSHLWSSRIVSWSVPRQATCKL
mmetsp:Transcript_1171/g.3154  ORF Transcript_1171/g.3154 Transcript_1171/m.3154 type:complete len:325 (+) Transcript_1171:234-1208(+)